MRLYFLRHTHAVAGADDNARPLSDKGKAQSSQLGHFCQRAGIVFDAAYSSPLIRARETAELVLAITNADRPVALERSEALLNETSPSAFYDWLDTLPGEKHILLVGHAPSLTDRVRHLLGITSEAGFDLPKGGLACLKTEDRRSAALKFFVGPKVL